MAPPAAAAPLAASCREALRRRGVERLDLAGLRAVLGEVFAQLPEGLLPRPDEAWFGKVFENYAPRCGGAMNLRCMEDAASQYCGHHLRKARESGQIQRAAALEALLAPPQSAGQAPVAREPPVVAAAAAPRHAPGAAPGAARAAVSALPAECCAQRAEGDAGAEAGLCGRRPHGGSSPSSPSEAAAPPAGAGTQGRRPTPPPDPGQGGSPASRQGASPYLLRELQGRGSGPPSPPAKPPGEPCPAQQLASAACGVSGGPGPLAPAPVGWGAIGEAAPSAATAGAAAADEEAAGGGASCRTAGGGVELASLVMFPTTCGHMAIYEQYDFDHAVLGEGHFGQVTVVTHRATGQRRACKCVGVEDEQDLRLVSTEMELLKRLDHPNILRLSESFVDGRNIYLVAELCEGGTLLEGFVRRGSSTSAAVCMTQVLGATAYCHARGVMHRDLKPDNVLYASAAADSVVKVIDFGLADSLARLRGPAQQRRRMPRVGTLAFMAPELVGSSGDYTEKVDVWAVGCILYLLLTGVHPFQVSRSVHPREARARIARGEILEHPNWSATAGPARDLVLQLLAVDPARRAGAAEALQHPWLRGAGAAAAAGAAACVPRSVFEGLREFQASSALKKAALKLLAKEAEEARLRDLREHFLALDGQQDGLLTRDELLHGMQQHLELRSLTLPDLASVLPPGSGGRISNTSFNAALLAQQGFTEAELRHAFQRLDIHGEGKLSPSTVREVLKAQASAPSSCVEANLAQHGAIDFEEFCALING